MRTLNCSNLPNRNEYIDLNHDGKGEVQVTFSDGDTMMMPVRRVVFHMFFWDILNDWKIPITRHFVTDSPHLNMEPVRELGTKILRYVTDNGNFSTDVYKKRMWEMINDLHNFIMLRCNAYHGTVDIISVCELANEPEVRAITDTKITVDSGDTISDSDKMLKERFKDLYSTLEDLDKPSNVLRHFMNLSLINSTQVAHILYQIGFRTDIDDTIIKYSIEHGYLDGIQNVPEFVFEALSAKKSVYMNKDAIPTAQYENRSQQLLASSLYKKYIGDCGSTVTVPIMLEEDMADKYYFKYIVDNGKLVVLSSSNVHKYIGKTIHLRSPLTCRHKNGVCSICYGKMLQIIADNTNVSMFVIFSVMEGVTQMILSSKHYQLTDMLIFKLQGPSKEVLTLKDSSIRIRRGYIKRVRSGYLGIATKDAVNLLNLEKITESEIDGISEAQFGKVTSIMFKDKRQYITNVLDTTHEQQAPVFSKHIIRHIKHNLKQCTTKDGFMWIPLDDFDFTKPLFRVIIVNNSMMVFVKMFKKFMYSTVATYTSIPEALQELIQILKRYVKINVVFIEMLLRSYLVTSTTNPHIPVVEDVNNVTFDTLDKITLKRSIGSTLAFEKLQLNVLDPDFYTVPRVTGPFDEFLNLTTNFNPPLK